MYVFMYLTAFIRPKTVTYDEAANALAKLRICADLPEPPLLAYAIRTYFRMLGHTKIRRNDKLLSLRLNGLLINTRTV